MAKVQWLSDVSVHTGWGVTAWYQSTSLVDSVDFVYFIYDMKKK